MYSFRQRISVNPLQGRIIQTPKVQRMNRANCGDDQVVMFRKKELRGSRVRCLMLTSIPRHQVASILTRLIEPIGSVNSNSDKWAPGGFLNPEEPKLGENQLFLPLQQREAVTDWWLKVRRNANTPNWDLVSTCNIDGKGGLILIEAKAHSNELKSAGKQKNNPDNDDQIGRAIYEANSALNRILPGWALTKSSHYQLCNRFAWSWKLATMGVPVVLIYLGFLCCDEMSDCGLPFNSAEKWERAIRPVRRCLQSVPQAYLRLLIGQP